MLAVILVNIIVVLHNNSYTGNPLEHIKKPFFDGSLILNNSSEYQTLSTSSSPNTNNDLENNSKNHENLEIYSKNRSNLKKISNSGLNLKKYSNHDPAKSSPVNLNDIDEIANSKVFYRQMNMLAPAKGQSALKHLLNFQLELGTTKPNTIYTADTDASLNKPLLKLALEKGFIDTAKIILNKLAAKENALNEYLQADLLSPAQTVSADSESKLNVAENIIASNFLMKQNATDYKSTNTTLKTLKLPVELQENNSKLVKNIKLTQAKLTESLKTTFDPNPFKVLADISNNLNINQNHKKQSIKTNLLETLVHSIDLNKVPFAANDTTRDNLKYNTTNNSDKSSTNNSRNIYKGKSFVELAKTYPNNVFSQAILNRFKAEN